MPGIRSADSFSVIRSALPVLYDPKVGVFAEINEHECEAGAARYFRYITRAADTRIFSGYQNFSIGGGSSTHRDAATDKGIGAATERYCSAIYRRDDYPLYAFKDAPFDCVPPANYAL